MKIIYGVGTGPGDPEMMTLKAVRIIKEGDIIFAPNNKGKNMALETSKEFVEGKKIILLDFPMKAVTEDTYLENARLMEESLEDGEVGVFLTIGDPMFYSTFINMKPHFSENVELKVVSGVPSFVAASGSAMIPCALIGEQFLVGDRIPEEVDEKITSIALLKSYNTTDEDLDKLNEMGFDYAYVQRASFPEEKILYNKEEIVEERDYISLIMARRKE